jgi:hypothetical protein
MQTNIAKLNTDRTKVQEVYATANGELVVTATATGASAIPVQGADSAGSNATANPVQVGGVNPTGKSTPFNTDANGNLQAVGNVASAATDSGNPVKVGGKYNSTRPTLTDGQRGDFQQGTRGSLAVQLMAPDSASNITATTPSTDGNSTGAIALSAINYPLVFNGTSWDRAPGNTSGTFVQGKTADGAAQTANSVSIAGKDGSGNVQTPLAAAGVTDAVSNAVALLYTRAFDSVFNGSTWDRSVKSNLTARLLTSAATTNSTLVKNAAGNLHKITLNVAVAGKFLKIYNKASAPTIGTDTPVMTIPLPTTGLVQLDFGANGHYFSAGIGFGLTGAIADADTTAVASGDITGINVIYS